MTAPTEKPPATLPSQRQITDALHSILRSHLHTTRARPRGSAFTPTPAQRHAELVQALQRAQRNL